MSKPAIPRGTRDFSPEQMRRRNYIFDTIRSVFIGFGFEQIETPAMENLEMLEGKYGEEGDKLMYRILNSGRVIDKIKEAGSEIKLSDITEKGLRYDLTVPFARYVVMNQNDIAFPFRRYQIQPVWRADNPQKGRYREFYQCDADIIGSNSLRNEGDLIAIIVEVFTRLNLGFKIKLNNRKILAGIAEVIGAPEKIIDITVAIDKLDKIGLDKVKAELKERGLSDVMIEKLEPIILLSGTNDEKLNTLSTVLGNSETGQLGIAEVREILRLANLLYKIPIPHPLEVDITLARGLNYYTGAIIEVKADDHRSKFTSSICGGGRYDDLTGIFGLPGVSGVGISFGADRISDVLEEVGGFPDFSSVSTQLLFVNFGEAEADYCFHLAMLLRHQGIITEVYPDPSKMKKQMSYADKKKIPFVALAGSNEIAEGVLAVKDMVSSEQHKVPAGELASFLKKHKH